MSAANTTTTTEAPPPAAAAAAAAAEQPPAAHPDGAEEEENLPLLARLVNHLLTPGSSLNPIMWIGFNVIMAILFGVWLMFVFALPRNVHVWAFGFLGLGLAASTNWMMKLIFSEGLDYQSQQQKKAEEEEEAAKKTDPSEPVAELPAGTAEGSKKEN